MSPPGLLTPLSFPHTQSGISVEVNVVDGSASDSESEPTTPPPEIPKEGRGAGCVMKKRGGMTSLSSICEEEDEETDADTVTEKDETTDDTASEGSFEGVFLSRIHGCCELMKHHDHCRRLEGRLHSLARHLHLIQYFSLAHIPRLSFPLSNHIA